MINFFLALLSFLGQLFDQLTYFEGLQESKKSPGAQYNANIEKLDKAIVNRDRAALASVLNELRPDKDKAFTRLPGPGSPSP